MTAPGLSRGLRTLLILSLAVNLLVAGMVLGRVVGGHRSGGERAIRIEGRNLGLGPAFAALPDTRRSETIARLGDRSGPLRRNREAFGARFEALLSALRAEPFEPDRVAELMRAQRDIARSRQEMGEEVLLGQITAMSAEERHNYAERLDRSLRRGDRH